MIKGIAFLHTLFYSVRSME